MKKEKVDHRRFDRLNIELLLKAGQDWKIEAFQRQGRELLRLVAREVEQSGRTVMTGERLREIMEVGRREYLIKVWKSSADARETP